VADLLTNSKQLYDGTLTTTSETTMYTVGASTKAIVLQVVVCNTTASAAVFSLSTVPTGGSAADGNRRLKSISVPAYETLIYDVFWQLDTDDFLSAIQVTSGALTFLINGAEVAV
jgi:hypothetical protein